MIRLKMSSDSHCLKTAAGLVLTGAGSALGACLVMLIVILFYQLAHTGSAADWILAIANVAMAVAAVAAFLVARSWLPQLTTQEGYKLAIELVNDHYIWLGVQNSVLKDVQLPVCYILHQFDRESMAGSDIKVDELIEKLEQAVLLHKKRRDKMKQIYFRLGTYGLRVTGAFEDRFLALDTAYMHAADGAGSILQILKETREQSGILPSNDSPLYIGGELVRDTYKLGAFQASGLFTEVSKQFQQMVEIHTSIFSPNPSIDKLFEIRR